MRNAGPAVSMGIWIIIASCSALRNSYRGNPSTLDLARLACNAGICCTWLLESGIPFAGADVAQRDGPYGQAGQQSFQGMRRGLPNGTGYASHLARHPSCASDRRHVREPTRSVLLISTSHRRIAKRGTLSWRAEPRVLLDRLQRNASHILIQQEHRTFDEETSSI
jgi:hypothetical protein